MDVATRTDAAAEADIDRFIERRAKQNDVSPAEARDLLWKESVRRHHAARRSKNKWEWVRYFDRMAASHAALAESYRERAEKLLEGAA